MLAIKAQYLIKNQHCRGRGVNNKEGHVFVFWKMNFIKKNIGEDVFFH